MILICLEALFLVVIYHFLASDQKKKFNKFLVTCVMMVLIVLHRTVIIGFLIMHVRGSG